MTDLRLSLTWDAYQKNICNGLGLLQQRGEFVDMTIAADGHHVKVHQMILSLVSPFIKELIMSAQCPHPVIFLNRVSYQTLQSILEYAYTGEVLVTRDKLDEFLEACRALSIKGLECEAIKSTADGGMLHVVDATDPSEPIYATKMSKIQQTRKTGVKRKRFSPPEVDNDESIHDSENSIEDSHIDDSNFDDAEYLDETIAPESQADNSQEDKSNPALSSMIQYSLSCQGSIQVVLNRFLYRLRHTRKNNERMWRCQDYSKKSCPAFVITKGDVVIERGCAHNHLYHDKQILKRVRNGNMFTSYNTIENMASLTTTKKKLSAT